MVIYSARHNNHRPSIQHFLSSLQFEACNEYHSARLSGDLDRYNDKWKQLKMLPEGNNELILHTNRHAHDITHSPHASHAPHLPDPSTHMS